MNRKNTILLAVFINAGLLVVLFVTALTSQEEIAIPLHLREEEGIAQVPRIVLEVEEELGRIGNAAAGEDGGGEEVEAVAGRQLLDR